MKVSVPRAYYLALKNRPHLQNRFEEVSTRLSSAGFKSQLHTFVACLREGKAAINMSIPRCNHFLKSGQWLNIYEVVAKETGKTGIELLLEVKNRIPHWYSQRRKLDELFGFRRDTHFASLNIGGGGAQRYGVCCVIFDLSHWEPYYTCYGGDSIRACFDADGNKILSDTDILKYFAPGIDVHSVAVIRHEDYLQNPQPGINLVDLRGIIEASDSLLEYHLHGKIGRSHIEKIILPGDKRNHYWNLALRSNSIPPPWPQEFDIVPHFLELVKLIDSYNIPLVTAETS